MGRARQLEDDLGERYVSGGGQFGFRWLTNPRERTWNLALGADSVKETGSDDRSLVYTLSLTYTFARGQRVSWR